MTSEEEPLQENKAEKSFVLNNIKFITRSLGLLTIAVMWVSTVIIIRDHDDSYVGYYLIGASTVTTFFEVTWLMNKAVCCVREGLCCKVWDGILWIDTWRKFIIYVGLAIPVFLEDFRIVVGILSGLLLIFLGSMYLVKTFKGTVTVTVYKEKVITKKAKEVLMLEQFTQTGNGSVEQPTTSPDTVTVVIPEEDVDGGTTHNKAPKPEKEKKKESKKAESKKEKKKKEAEKKEEEKKDQKSPDENDQSG